MIRIVAKDDCFTTYLARTLRRRGVDARVLAQQSKTTSALLIDSLFGIQAPFAELEQMFSRADCLKQQESRSTLLVPPGDANLVIIGSFSDLTIRDYRGGDGWRFFDVSAAVTDPDALAQYERCEHLTPQEAIANTAYLFSWFHDRHPDAKLLWIEYPHVKSDIPLKSNIPVENRILVERHAAFAEAADAVLPKYGVTVYRVPPEIVATRSDGRLWHYADAVYEHAAEFVGKMFF